MLLIELLLREGKQFLEVLTERSRFMTHLALCSAKSNNIDLGASDTNTHLLFNDMSSVYLGLDYF